MKTLEPTTAIVATVACTHCGGQLQSRVFDDQNNVFCCPGCRTVYDVLHSKGLEEYYQIKAQTQSLRARAPVELSSTKFNYLDDSEFLQEYSYRNQAGQRCMEFYLEGIHCLACLWLIEKLPFLLPSVLSSKLNMEKSIVTITLCDVGHFAPVALELSELGYRPHPMKKNQSAYEFKLKEERIALLRIGVAAAGASNIMLYAVSNYAGATGLYASVFNALSVAFALPVLTFSAWPFYRNSWFALKQRTLAIDVPISLSLLVGLGMGLYNLVLGVPDNYFDSLTALVFLLLLSRYFLRKIQERALGAQDLHFFYQSESVWRAKSASWLEFEEVHPRFIRVDDALRIAPGEFIPVDGTILRGRSHINAALLTGEVTPRPVEVGAQVFAGTQNVSEELIVRAEKINQETRLGQILKGVENGWSQRPSVVDLADRIAKYFISTVFALAVLLFVKEVVSGSWHQALEQALTLLIVTCPCALALAIPLTFTRSLSKAAQSGIIIKNDAVIQKLSEIKEVFLDKTGTLTLGKVRVEQVEVLEKAMFPIADVVLTLESSSRHPLALALVEWARSQGGKLLAISELLETPGVGVEGKIAGVSFQINRHGLIQDRKLIARFVVSDQVRSEAAQVVRELHEGGVRAHILSGDGLQSVEAVACDVGIPLRQSHFAVTPEQKGFLVGEADHAMMVGDGANDALALTKAHVGVAVLGSMDISLRAADVYLSNAGIRPVKDLIVLGRETMRVIRRNLVLSLIYNSLSVLAAFMGWIGPLTAAIIMPASSLTVLLSTLWGTEALRNLWKS